MSTAISDPVSANADSSSNSTHAPSNRPPRNRRRGRGPPRHANDGPSHPHALPQRTIDGGRNFGGQLTRLDAEAIEFVPASLPPSSSSQSRATSQASNHSKPLKPKANQIPASAPQGSVRGKRRASLLRSTAPDIITRVHEDISKGIYECAICTNEISRNSKIWSCRTCWTVFHIGCIKKWSKNEGATVPHQSGADESQVPAVKQWRCPGCNLPKDTLPSSYACWCEKELDPKIIGGLPPHSCGQTCGRERLFPRACPHPCDLLCHAGPCPPCTHMGPNTSCFCGKQATSRKCSETDYDSGWSCGQICGDVMPCGDHNCDRPCHEGLCGACETKVDSRCYCGKDEKIQMCSEKGEEKASHSWIGSFDCHQTCNNLMDCGEHHCERSCHPQDEGTPHCPRSPDVVSECPCGKTKLSSLQEKPRASCTDPIPNCDKQCERPLSCGHLCTQICHSGDCLPCFKTVTTTCRCGRNTFDTMCYQGVAEPPQCMRICKATLNCGRHECGEHCCTGERKAIERQATKRKLKPLGAVARAIDDNMEAEHICTRSCDRPLKCGNHSCSDLCHRGPCGSCREAVFDDISCACGRTVLQAPLPCGTKPPPCSFPCRQPKSCGHPQVAHNCHSGDEACPNCPYLTEKACLCGKKTLKNQPCWRSDVLCGLVCGKTLKCGSHNCRKLCHRQGQCEDFQSSCQQECSKAKKSCGHPCEKSCHAPAACKEDKPCPFKIMITCDCQRKKEEVRCNARATAPEPAGRQNSLKCDDECARLGRNRQLALALHISDDHTDDHVPYSTATLKLYLEDTVWSHRQENILRVFAADANEKRLRFEPMKQRQRAFIHSVAEDFGFDGESLDPEPHRHVLLFKTPKFVAAPMKTLAQAARIRRAALNVSTANPVAEAKADVASHEYNGLLLTKLKFALTEDELRPHVAKAAPTTRFDILFMSSMDAIALMPSQSWDTPEQVTTLLKSLQPTISAELARSNLAQSVTLCQFAHAGIEPRIIRQQGKQEPGVTYDGWSQVAAKKSGVAQAPRVEAVGQRPVYTVLGSKLAEARRKKLEREEEERRREAEQAEVVDDWEMEVEEEEGSPSDVGAAPGAATATAVGAEAEAEATET